MINLKKGTLIFFSLMFLLPLFNQGVAAESTPVAPSGYVYCADEGYSYTLPGICDIAYGVDGKFSYLYNKIGQITFTNTVFGDPVPGVVKHGFYKLNNNPSTPKGPEGYIYCANENDSFKLPQVSDVAYGANGKFSYLYNQTGIINFTNLVFGDPLPAVGKYGFYKLKSNKVITNTSLKTNLFPQKTGNYLIITSEEARPWLTNFVEYRKSKYNVTVASTATIGNTKEQIKNYIESQYANQATRPEFLLLVMKRDTDRKSHAIDWYKVPASYAWGDEITNSYSPYSLLTGNDMIPDVYLGLFSVIDQAEVDYILAKIKSIELNGMNYPNRMGAFMSLAQEQFTGVVIPYLNSVGWGHSEYYNAGVWENEIREKYETISSFKNILESGVRYMWTPSHGAPWKIYGISTDWLSDFKANTDVYPVGYTHGCNVGNWSLGEGENLSEVILTEALVSQVNSPYIAMMANSSYGGHFNFRYGDKLLSQIVEGVSNLGQIHHSSLLHSLNTGKSEELTSWYEFNLNMIHLWGDPATELRGINRIPYINIVNGKGSGYSYNGSTITISADIPSNSDLEFNGWVGDTSVLANKLSRDTTLIVPERDVLIEATYRCKKTHQLPGTFEAESFSGRKGGLPNLPFAPVASQFLPGNWYEYNLKFKNRANYSISMLYAATREDAKISIVDASNNKKIRSFTLPRTDVNISTWMPFDEINQKWSTIGSIYLPAGNKKIRIRLDSGRLSIDKVKFK